MLQPAQIIVAVLSNEFPCIETIEKIKNEINYVLGFTICEKLVSNFSINAIQDEIVHLCSLLYTNYYQGFFGDL